MTFQCFDEIKCINIIILKILTLGLYFIVLHFPIKVLFSGQIRALALLTSRYFSYLLTFLFSDLLCMCACVYIHFYACKMIACSM